MRDVNYCFFAEEASVYFSFITCVQFIMSEDSLQNGSSENGTVPEIELIIKVSGYKNFISVKPPVMSDLADQAYDKKNP